MIRRSTTPVGAAAWGFVPARAQRILTQEAAQTTATDPTLLTAGETATAAAGGGTITAKLSSQIARTLTRAEKKLIASNGKAAAARVKRDHVRDLEAEARQRGQIAEANRDRDGAENAAAPAHAYLPHWLLNVITVVLLSAESGFFYLAMARDLTSADDWTSPARLSAALFAIFCPLSGILTSRLMGSALGRYHRAPATDPAQRAAQKAAVVASTVVAAVATVGLAALVRWRYDTSATLSLTAAVPGWAVACLFVAVMLGLGSAHAYAVPVVSHHERANTREIAKLTKKRVHADTAVVNADTRHGKDAAALAMAITTGVALLERVTFTTEDVIHTGRARTGTPALTALSAAANASGAQATPISLASSGTHLVEPAPGRPFPAPVLPETLWHHNANLPQPALLALTQAIATLHAYGPTIHPAHTHCADLTLDADIDSRPEAA